MERDKVVEFINEQIDFLKAKEVEKLMNAGDVRTLKEIGKKLDYSILNQYVKQEDSLKLKESELPENSELELLLYICNNKKKHSDYKLLNHWMDFHQALRTKYGELGEKIAPKLFMFDLSDFTIEELLEE